MKTVLLFGSVCRNKINDKFAGADWLLDEMTIVKDGVRI